jgi:hypothetical protein
MTAALLIVPVILMFVMALICAMDGTTTTHSSRTSDEPEVIRYTANGKVTRGSLLKR